VDGDASGTSFGTVFHHGDGPITFFTKALFSWQNFWQNATVALSLLFGN
jgi:hypothetical protein